MRFRKTLLSFAAAISLFGTTTSAFAFDGFADDYRNPYVFSVNSIPVLMPLTSFNDSDWFKIDPNNVSQYAVTLVSPQGTNYNMDVYFDYGNSGTPFLMQSGENTDPGMGYNDGFNMTVYPGVDVYLRVYSKPGYPISSASYYLTAIGG